MKLFITGSEGFVGKALVAQCEKQNIDYLAVDIIEKNSPKYVRADIRSASIADVIPDGTDALIHLAALSRDPDCKNKAFECFDANVMATINLMNAAEKRNIKHFVFASSEWVYGSFKEGEIKTEDTVIDIAQLTSEYALSKLVSEANIRQKVQHDFGNATVLRFGIIYGPRKGNWSAVESIVNAVKTQDVVTVGALKTARCFIHVEDVVSGIIASLGNPQSFSLYNLCGDESVSLGTVIKVSSELLNKRPEVKQSNPASANMRHMLNTKIKKALDWKPAYTIKAGIQSVLN